MGGRTVRIAAGMAAAGCLLGGCGQAGRPAAATGAPRPAKVAAAPRASAAASPTASPTATPPPAASPSLITVPAVTGRPYEPAQAAVGEAGLDSDYRLQHSAAVTAGLVISQAPAAGAHVPASTVVILVVSTGPANIAGAQPCQARHLRLQPGPGVSEATEQLTSDWSATNVGPACVLDGYPAVTALDRAGRVLGFTYTHSGDQMTTAAKPVPVYLPTGSTAWIRLNQNTCNAPIAGTTRTLQFSLPAGGGTMDVPPQRGMDYCPNDESTTIAVSPFEPVQMVLYSGL